MNELNRAFKAQKRIRGPWRRYLDALAPLRPDLHRYCCRLTGNVWDGEDLVQDTLIRVFSMLGKTDVQLENPRVPDSHGDQSVDRPRSSRRARAGIAGTGCAGRRSGAARQVCRAATISHRSPSMADVPRLLLRHIMTRQS